MTFRRYKECISAAAAETFSLKFDSAVLKRIAAESHFSKITLSRYEVFISAAATETILIKIQFSRIEIHISVAAAEYKI